MEVPVRKGDQLPPKISPATREEANLDAALETQYKKTEEWKRGAGAEQWQEWRLLRNAAAGQVAEKSPGPHTK